LNFSNATGLNTTLVIYGSDRLEMGLSVAPLGLFSFRRYLDTGAYAPAYVSFASLGLFLFRRYLDTGAYAPAYVSFAPLGLKNREPINNQPRSGNRYVA